MKLISYNVNGIRAAQNKGFTTWLAQEAPDVIGLQEIKAMDDQFDWQLVRDLGYEVYTYPAQKKGYSGVALLTKTKPNQVTFGCGVDWIDFEGRIVRADYDDFSFISVYIPSGSSGDERQVMKMKFLDFFGPYIENLSKTYPKLIISGDYNICHQAIDIHDPVRNATMSGFLPEEREWFTSFLNRGFIDSFRELVKEPNHYSWWSYRAGARANNKGWRIDYHIITEALRPQLQHASILPAVNHSDHCPVTLILS
ncbi:MAG: exodeoxyribonuclease III [Sphingobacteriaceae bacterium]|nr:exodeoxyribonuclease III [Sphingobacteriaceae bacterium]